MILPYSAWPAWLQVLVVAPNGLLLGYACWVWWPKSDCEWRKFGWVLAYLIAFYSVLIFVFHFR